MHDGNGAQRLAILLALAMGLASVACADVPATSDPSAAATESLASLPRDFDADVATDASQVAIAERTTVRFGAPSPSQSNDFVPLSPLPDQHTLWPPITVRAVFKGAGRVAVGGTLMLRYSDRDRHRTEFTQDMTGCAFLERLREEIGRSGAGG